MGVDLDRILYALDSTTIDLCLSLFPLAAFHKHKAAVKMHKVLDLQGNIPTFIRITDGKVDDVNILDEIMPEAGAFYEMDRGLSPVVEGQNDEEREADGGGESEEDEAVEQREAGAAGGLFFVFWWVRGLRLPGITHI